MQKGIDFVVLREIVINMSLKDALLMSLVCKKFHNKMMCMTGWMAPKLMLHTDVEAIHQYFEKYKALASDITQIDTTERYVLNVSLFPNLKTLSLKRDKNLGFDGNLPNLERLELYGQDAFDQQHIITLLDACTERIVSLNLSEQIMVDSYIIGIIVARFPNLEDLDISWCQQVRAKDITNIRLKCLKLKRLTMFCCDGIYEDDVIALNSRLEYFDRDLVPIRK